MILNRALCSMLCIGVSSACLGLPTTSALPATVCELVRAPEKFSGKDVRINAYIDSDGLEWVLLKDDACARNGVNLEYSDSAANGTDARRIREAIFHTKPLGTDYKDIRGAFFGRFQWMPQKRDPHVRMRFIVSRIEHLEIASRLQKRPSPFPELH
jgi:hypothetical protein